MTRLTDELKKKLRKAQNAAEVTGLLKDVDESEILADQIWSEISRHREDMELSWDELEAVSGGTDRDWLKDGCAATVEPGSWCDSNDYCYCVDVTYKHKPLKDLCPVCGHYLYIAETQYGHRPSDDVDLIKCSNCGYSEWH